MEMMIGGLKGVDADAGVAAVLDRPVIVEFGAPLEARRARSKVLAWTALVDDVAKRSGVDRALLMAVIDVESGGDPFAVSPKGARGLMQLMPQTGAQQGAGDLFDPYQNVVAGTRLLDSLLTTFGDVPLALAAYNAGEGAVRKFGGTVPPYAETQRYVRRVMERVADYRR
ncbi:Membrane-bound lytic murein transglycosylase D precursor [Paraburkholderia caribensis MBA4]|uniref:Membrane-bound lytic murein transglycosylase D n=2 Tax=Paraburkholderia caribensis TaxID=75105 RepID=A0A0P0RGZ0_9BURK|nr:Membrane-bound lytic murein transglycosylase D precursor [Paraburkholderia caribensis MBA4]